jgi:hypothetical protein
MKAVDDGAAERRHLGRFLVDVDELVVAGRIREHVDLVLGHLDPFAAAEGFADLRGQILRCSWKCSSRLARTL